MKNFSYLILVLILVLHACKDDCAGNMPCEGPECPLSTGEYCPPGFNNVNDQCECPEGLTEFDNKCIDLEDPFFEGIDNIMFDYLNCGCVENQSIIFNFLVDSSSINGWYISNGTSQPLYFNSNLFGPATVQDFYANIYPYGRCEPGDLGSASKPLFMHGSLIGDTLYYDLFFFNTNDTCKGFKQGDARL